MIRENGSRCTRSLMESLKAISRLMVLSGIVNLRRGSLQKHTSSGVSLLKTEPHRTLPSECLFEKREVLLVFFYPRILSKSVSFRIRLNAEASSHANCVSCGLSMAIVRLLISPIVFNVFVMADLFYCSRNNCRPCQYDNVCWVIEKYGLVTVYSKMLQWSQRTTPNL